MVLSGPYQGNKLWALFVFAVIVILFHILWGLRMKRDAGLPVNVHSVVFVCLVLLTMLAAGMFQIVSHW